MFSNHEQEQKLYHSIATIGTLLLQIGEVGKRFLYKSESGDSVLLTEPDLTLSCSLDSQDEVSSSFSSTNIDVASDSKTHISDAAAESGAKLTEKEKPDEPDVATVHPVSGQTSGPDADSHMSSESRQRVSSSESRQRVSSSESQQSAATCSSSSRPDSDWSISFEQFLASMLTEPVLVNFFEQVYEVTDAVSHMRNKRLLTRQNSPLEAL